MDSGTIIITLIFIAVVTAPFILTGYNKNKKKKGLLGQLEEMAGKEDCNISYHEFCCNFVIGLDETKNHLFFYKKAENQEFAKSINLQNYNSCKMYNSNRTVGEKKEKYYVVDRLELIFYPAGKETPEVSIEFYNDDYDRLTLSGELQLAEKWEKLLNERLKRSQKIKPKAANQPAANALVPDKQKPRKTLAV